MTGDGQQTQWPFIKARYAEFGVTDIGEDWLLTLEVQPMAVNTIANYRKALLSFTKSLALHNLPPVLACLTDVNMKVWSIDLRLGSLEDKKHRRGTLANPWMPPGQSAIRFNLSVLKDFATQWLKGRYATVNLLQTLYVGHGIIEPLSQADRAALLEACNGDSFDQIRDRAFIRLLLATACRFDEIHSLLTDRIDMNTSRMWITLSSGRSVPLSIDSTTLRELQIYLGRRRLVAAPGDAALWLKDNGAPLTYWTTYAVLLRLAATTVVDCNPRQFRYTVAQMATLRGFPVELPTVPPIATERESRVAKLALKYSLSGASNVQPNPSTTRALTRKATPPHPEGPPASSPSDAETQEWRGPRTSHWGRPR